MSNNDINLINKDLLESLFKEINKLGLKISKQNNWNDLFLFLNKQESILILMSDEKYKDSKYFFLSFNIKSFQLVFSDSFKINNNFKILSIQSNTSEEQLFINTVNELVIINTSDIIKLKFQEIIRFNKAENDIIKVYPYSYIAFGIVKVNSNKSSSFELYSYNKEGNGLSLELSTSINDTITDFNFVNINDSIKKHSWETFAVVFLSSIGDLYIKTPIFIKNMIIPSKKIAEFSNQSQSSNLINNKLSAVINKLAKDDCLVIDNYITSFQQSNSESIICYSLLKNNLLTGVFSKFIIIESRPLTFLRFAQNGVDLIVMTEEPLICRSSNNLENRKSRHEKMKSLLLIQEYLSKQPYSIVSYNKFSSFKDVIISKEEDKKTTFLQLLYNTESGYVSLSKNIIEEEVTSLPIFYFKHSHFISFYMYFSKNDNNYFFVEEILEEGYDSFIVGDLSFSNKKEKPKEVSLMTTGDLLDIKTLTMNNLKRLKSNLQLNSLYDIYYRYPDKINEKDFTDDLTLFFHEITQNISIFKDYNLMVSNNFYVLSKYHEYNKQNTELINKLNDQLNSSIITLKGELKKINEEKIEIKRKEDMLAKKIATVQNKLMRVFHNKNVIGVNIDGLKALKDTVEKLCNSTISIKNNINLLQNNEQNIINQIKDLKFQIPKEFKSKIIGQLKDIHSVKDEAMRTVIQVENSIMDLK